MNHARLRQRILTVVALLLLMASCALTAYVVDLRSDVRRLRNDVRHNGTVGVANQRLLCDIHDHVLNTATATCRAVPE
jgi:hypothetical protein